MAAVRQLPVIQAVGAAQAAPPPVPREDDRPDWGATRCLVAATAVAALVGVPLGLTLAYWSATGQMAVVPWVGLVQAHGQAQLFGWLGLAILGVTFHAMSHLFGTGASAASHATGRVSATVLALQLVGVGLRLTAPLVPLEVAALPWSAGGWLLLGSALALLGAFVVTLQAHARTLPRRRGMERAPGAPAGAPAVLPRYLLVGVFLWLAALIANLDGAIDALRFGAPAAGAISAGRDLFVITAAGGGMALIALGMSLRVVVGWLDLPAPDLARAQAAWLPLALGTVLRAATAAVGGPPALEAFAALAWTLGVLNYLPALRGLWSRDAVTAGGGRRGEADPPLAWFVRAAYAGLAVSAVLAVLEVWAILFGEVGPISPHALAESGRHALLFGFLGVLTAGLSGRLPTAFVDLGERGIRATHGAYRAARFLLAPAAALRVLGPLVGDARGPVIGLAGVLATAGLCALLAVHVRLVRMRLATSPAS